MTAVDRTTEAMEVAGLLAAEVIYEAIADAVSTAIRYCTLHAQPLNDDQVTQLMRATIESCDGIHDKLARAIDGYAVRRIETEGLS